MKKVFIVGIGWLGEYIAEYLQQKDFLVSGSVRNAEKAEALEGKYEKVYSFDVSNSDYYDSIPFQEYDFFVVAIPPNRLSVSYADSVFALIKQIQLINPNARFLYTSSTSVYSSGEKEVDESTPPNPKTDSAIEILKLESLFLASATHSTTIVRLGGLCGGNRHPVRVLSAKKELGKPNAVVNLIHQEDICRFVNYVIENQHINGIYNLCSAQHPERRSYYEWSAKQLGLPIPSFKKENLKDKTVICKAITKLNFKLKYSSPYDYPELKTDD